MRTQINNANCKWIQAATLAVLILARSATAGVTDPSIVVGDHELLANTTNQLIQIFVTGGNAVQGLNFNAQIADAGPSTPECQSGGMIDGPNITAADILSGTIFDGNNTGAPPQLNCPQLAVYSTTTLLN